MQHASEIVCGSTPNGRASVSVVSVDRKSPVTATGVVISDKRDKTRTVDVRFKSKHPKYGKLINKRTRLHVHDPRNESRIGDRVEVAPCRPMSALKRWRLVRIRQSLAQELDKSTPIVQDMVDARKIEEGDEDRTEADSLINIAAEELVSIDFPGVCDTGSREKLRITVQLTSDVRERLIKLMQHEFSLAVKSSEIPLTAVVHSPNFVPHHSVKEFSIRNGKSFGECICGLKPKRLGVGKIDVSLHIGPLWLGSYVVKAEVI